MSDKPVFDPETASLEELKIQADLQTAQPEATPAAEPAEAAVVETPEEAVVPPAEKTIYQRRIDLGDGSGVQVFQADSIEELVDKLVTAQENATRKIRELNAKVPKVEAKKERSADDEFVLSQELMSRPTKAFEKMFQETVGMPIGDFRNNLEAMNAFNRAQTRDKAIASFIEKTPDYFANPTNGKRMQDYLKTYRLPETLDSLVTAYTELTASGLLQAKPAPVVNHTEEVEGEAETVEVQPGQVRVAEHVRTAPKRAASGLSSRGSIAPTKPVKSGPTEQELYDMPLEQLKELSMRGGR